MRSLVYRDCMNQWFERKIWKLGHGRQLELGPRSIIMGVLNVTPDSFSDGGKYDTLEAAIHQARSMAAEGADIIDIGGESTRPGSTPVSERKEQSRILEIIEALVADGHIVSVDTWRASTAKKAVLAGAHIINDVWGFHKDPELANVAAESKSGICAMHTGREREKLDDVLEDQALFLEKSLDILGSAGVEDAAITLDPGFGFAKDPQENIKLLARLEELHAFGYPLLVGTSRKRFIGHFTGREAEKRDIGTAATSVVARMKGAGVFRVHDVAANRDALAMTDAVISTALAE